MKKLSVIIPCFNEERSIDELIHRVEAATLPQGWDKELIIVDDHSTDGTRAKLAAYASRHTVVLREKNGGKGAALKSGMEKESGDFILIQDADLEYDPNDYSRLISALDERHTVVFGSRFLASNAFFNVAYLYGNRMLTKFFNLFFGSKLTDITTCYKLFPREAIPALLTWPENDFVFDAVYLTYGLYSLYSPVRDIVEVPITYTPRNRMEGKKVGWWHGFRFVIAMAELFVKKNAQFFKYLIAGGFVFSVHLSVLYFLTAKVHIYYLTSAVISFLTAFIISFILQKFWTFKNKSFSRVHHQLLQYLTLQLANLILNTYFLYLFVQYLHIWYLVSQTIVSIGLGIATFFVARKYIFKNSGQPSNSERSN